MSDDVQFDEGQYITGTYSQLDQQKTGGLTNVLLSSGIVKDKKQADLVLLGVAGFFLLATIFMIVRTFTSGPSSRGVSNIPIPPEIGVESTMENNSEQ